MERAHKREQLRQDLMDLIRHHGGGSRLPSERELSDRFAVARETLRRLLGELEEEGLLERRHGAGTFVVGTSGVKPFKLISFSEDMRERGLEPSSRLLATRTVAAGAKLAQKFRITPGTPLLEIRRLRLADDEPMALETASLLQDRLPGFDPARLERQSLYELLAQDFGIQMRAAALQIQATVLTEAEAELLDVAPFSPALLVERQVAASSGEVIEYGKSLYRADRYRYEVGVTRPAPNHD